MYTDIKIGKFGNIKTNNNGDPIGKTTLAWRSFKDPDIVALRVQSFASCRETHQEQFSGAFNVLLSSGVLFRFLSAEFGHSGARNVSKAILSITEKLIGAKNDISTQRSTIEMAFVDDSLHIKNAHIDPLIFNLLTFIVKYGYELLPGNGATTADPIRYMLECVPGADFDEDICYGDATATIFMIWMLMYLEGIRELHHLIRPLVDMDCGNGTSNTIAFGLDTQYLPLLALFLSKYNEQLKKVYMTRITDYIPIPLDGVPKADLNAAYQYLIDDFKLELKDE